MATLRFLGHAGYCVEQGSVCLAVDPWLSGPAFDNGWDLLVPSAPFEAQKVTHLWFSHEHPDHFSIGAVKAIPEARRPEVTVVFQRTADGRVVSFLRKHGFAKVVEVANGERVELGPDISLTTSMARDGDSCHLLAAGAFRMINFNDCWFASMAEVEGAMKAFGVKPGEVDLVASQFSYANWMGNPGEPARRQDSARVKLAHLEMEVKSVQPRFVMPFASYVYFSHQENAYLNDSVNRPSVVAERVRSMGMSPVVCRPGDVMELSGDGLRAASAEAGSRAAELDAHVDAVQRGEKPLRKSDAVPLEDVLATVRGGLERLRKGMAAVDFALMRLRLRRASFELSDHKNVVVVETLRRVKVEPAGTPADVTVSSEALKFAFQQDFGFDTLLVNGRFQECRPRGVETVMTLCGQFGYVRRKQSLVKSILKRRLYDAPRLALERVRNRALPTQ
ncbi:MAG TPA: hypothetical protein VIG99_16580 [Myxococcaceae bacterium]|jgi:hypothetical protein